VNRLGKDFIPRIRPLENKASIVFHGANGLVPPNEAGFVLPTGGLISVPELFMAERSGPAQQGEARL
jgi:hypothetical protein